MALRSLRGGRRVYRTKARKAAARLRYAANTKKSRCRGLKTYKCRKKYGCKKARGPKRTFCRKLRSHRM